MTPYQLAYADAMGPAYASGKVLSRLLVEARQLGWAGSKLIGAQWHSQSGILSLAIAPGQGEPTLDDVRALLAQSAREKK